MSEASAEEAKEGLMSITRYRTCKKCGEMFTGPTCPLCGETDARSC